MGSTEDILSADKLLFAIDLIDYVIIRTRPNFCEKTVNILARADRLRNLTYNHFTKTIRNALNILDINQDTSVFNDFAKMKEEKRVNKESFIEFANNYRERNLSGEFQSKHFLIYCVRVANMAGYFLSFGVEDAPDIALELIMQAFSQVNMYHSTWSKIAKVAESYELLGDYHYDDSMSSDSSSESIDQITSENEDSAPDSINMDVNISSPEDSSQTNVDNPPSILRKALEYRNGKSSSSRTINIRFEGMKNAQSSGSACSSYFSSLSKFSSYDASTRKILDNVPSVPRKSLGYRNAKSSCSRAVDIRFEEMLNAQSSDSTCSSSFSSISKFSSTDASPTSPEERDVSKNDS